MRALGETPDGGVPKQPLILYLKRNCLDDGPGIRTTVFLKGCPLDCAWCHNPESKRVSVELAHDPIACIGCGACSFACPLAAIGKNVPSFIDRERCNLCFACVDACPSGAIERLGGAMDAGEVIAIIKKDIPFFRTSGGGVTLSGGEPALFMDFAAEILDGCRKLGIHTIMETSALFDFDRFRMKIYPLLDNVYVDVKLVNPEQHKKYCGVSNERILENIRRLAKLAAEGGAAVLPRVPLVPGITDTDENLRGIARFLKECGFTKVALLPYNPTWHNKTAMIGMKSGYDFASWMSAEEIARCHAHFADFVIEGNSK